MDRFLSRSSSLHNLKRPAEDSADAWKFPKKTASLKNQAKFDKSRNVSTENRYEDLDLDDQADTTDAPDVKYKKATTHPKKTGRIPGIFLDIKPEWTHGSIKDMVSKHTNLFHLQYGNNNSVAIMCYSSAAHQALKKGLLEDNAPFTTFTRKDEQSPKVVIKGLPAHVEEEVPAELNNLGFPGATVIKLKSKNTSSTKNSPFMIQLPAGTDISKFRKIKYLCHCVIRIEKYKPNRTSGTQCFRCQRFGHSSRNCNMPPRCVKCTSDHATADCSKKDRTEPAKCCNCNEEHPANYGKCPVRLEYLLKIQKKKSIEHNIPKKIFWDQKPNSNERQGQQQAIHGSGPRAAKNAWRVPLMGRSSTADETDKPKITENDDHNPEFDETSKEILQIMTFIQNLRKDFTACSTVMEKVMLVMMHMDHCNV